MPFRYFWATLYIIGGRGAVAYWIGPLTLDQRVLGSIPVNAWHILSLLLLSTQVYKWVPGRMRTLFQTVWIGTVAPVKWRLVRILLMEWKIVHGIKCGIEIESNDRGNNNVWTLWLYHSVNVKELISALLGVWLGTTPFGVKLMGNLALSDWSSTRF